MAPFPERIFITLKNRFLLLVSTVILILLWKLLSTFMGSEIILPSPESAFRALIELFYQKNFAQSVLFTIRRGLIGFLLSASAALVLGIAAGENKIVYNLFKPLLTIVKTVPLLSVVLLAIIWFKTENVPVFVCFLVVFPVISANVIEGIKNVDSHLLEMAGIYRVGKKRIILQIYLPSLVPYLLAGLSTAAGITWKAVIAAEVISMPRYAIGTAMQLSQIQLNTADLFAWTIIAVIISAASEVFLMALQHLLPWRRIK